MTVGGCDMVTGVGTDIIDISRVRRLWSDHCDHLENDLLTASEYKRFRAIIDDTNCESAEPNRATWFLATRLAVKEAAFKALGAPRIPAFNWCDIEVLGDSDLSIRVSGELGNAMKETNCPSFVASVKCDGRFCLAFVIGVTT